MRPHPWDSPGKNTGVGCHFPLQCIKVKSESEVAQSWPTLRDPMDCSLPGSSVHGIFQARVLERSTLPSPLCSLSWPIKELPEGLYVELLLLGIVLPGPWRVLRLSQVIPGRSMSNPGGSGPLAAWPSEVCVCVCTCMCVCLCVCMPINRD